MCTVRSGMPQAKALASPACDKGEEQAQSLSRTTPPRVARLGDWLSTRFRSEFRRILQRFRRFRQKDPWAKETESEQEAQGKPTRRPEHPKTTKKAGRGRCLPRHPGKRVPLQATENKWSRAQPHFLSLTCRREHKVPSLRSCALPHTRGESGRPEVYATYQAGYLEDHGHAKVVTSASPR